MFVVSDKKRTPILEEAFRVSLPHSLSRVPPLFLLGHRSGS